MRRIVFAGLLALSATPSLAQTPAPQPALHLACAGVAIYSGADGHPVSAEGQTLIELTGSTAGRVKLPDILTPFFHDNTDEGWRPLGGLVVTDSAITGQLSLNFLNKPTIAIDRVTGHMEVKSGAQPVFGGECRSYDPAARTF